MWGFATGERWVTKLGFKFESQMLLYSPKGETFDQYVMFPVMEARDVDSFSSRASAFTNVFPRR